MARCLSLFGAQAQAMRVVGQMLPNLSVVDRQKVWVGAYERERDMYESIWCTSNLSI